MIISLVSWKGGCGKTTTAIHFAALLSRHGKTLLIDDDRNENALSWHRRGEQRLPFQAVTYNQSLRVARNYDHFVVDTRGGLDDKDLVSLYDEADIVVVPAIIESMTLEAMVKTVNVLRQNQKDLSKLRVLFAQTRNKKKVEEARTLVRDLGLTPLTATIRDTEAFKDACDAGLVVANTRNPLGKIAWLDYERAFNEVLSSVPAAVK